MDPNAIAAAAAQPTGIQAWLATNGQIVYFFAQIAYWFFMVVFIGYAVAQYKRWVNFELGIGHSGKLREDNAAEETEDVPVDEFVE